MFSAKRPEDPCAQDSLRVKIGSPSSIQMTSQAASYCNPTKLKLALKLLVSVGKASAGSIGMLFSSTSVEKTMRVRKVPSPFVPRERASALHPLIAQTAPSSIPTTITLSETATGAVTPSTRMCHR